MSSLEALILGLIQGLTEFLPISSSGHIELAKAVMGVEELKKDVTFTVVVHGATVLSTIVIFFKEIKDIFRDLFKFQWNNSTNYTFQLAISIIPVDGILFSI